MEEEEEEEERGKDKNADDGDNVSISHSNAISVVHQDRIYHFCEAGNISTSNFGATKDNLDHIEVPGLSAKNKMGSLHE